MRQKALNSSRIFASSFRSGKLIMAVILAGLSLLTVPASVRTQGKPGTSQQKEKVVLKHAAPANEPIEIIDPSVEAQAIKLGEGFETKSDWLRTVTFKIRNRSDKAITFLQIDLDFPETKETAGAIMMHQLFLGQRPDFKSTLKNAPLYIKPDETLEISLEAEYAQIKTLIELKHPSVDVINKLVIRTNSMMFEDGSLYSGGFFLRRNPDPNHPQKWIQIADTSGAAKHN